MSLPEPACQWPPLEIPHFFTSDILPWDPFLKVDYELGAGRCLLMTFIWCHCGIPYLTEIFCCIKKKNLPPTGILLSLFLPSFTFPHTSAKHYVCALFEQSLGRRMLALLLVYKQVLWREAKRTWRTPHPTHATSPFSVRSHTIKWWPRKQLTHCARQICLAEDSVL